MIWIISSKILKLVLGWYIYKKSKFFKLVKYDSNKGLLIILIKLI